MYFLSFKNFIRNKAVITGLLFLLVAGMISLYVGYRFLQKQQTAIVQTQTYQQQQIARNVKYHGDDLGLLLYYVKFGIVNHTLPLAGISIGQRDVNPSIQQLTIRGLENQRYDTDLYNPANLLLGNLDLSFVIIYLFPLLIIAFTYNILSEEKEAGIWKLLQTQAKKPLRYLIVKLLHRMYVVLALLFLLLLMAAFVFKIPFDVSFLYIVILFLLYIIFWFALCFWVVSWQRSSATNAIALLALWIGIILLAPAIVNSYITARYKMPEALANALQQRKGYHEKWDMPPEPTMEKFYAHYPQFKKYVLPGNKAFTWLWYYAMQQMGDDDAAAQTRALLQKVQQRSARTTAIALLLPALHTQLAINNTAQTDVNNHLQFLQACARFHEKNRLMFYPKIFEKEKADSVDWSKAKLQYFKTHTTEDWWKVLPLLGFAAVGFIVGIINCKHLT